MFSYDKRSTNLSSKVELDLSETLCPLENAQRWSKELFDS